MKHQHIAVLALALCLWTTTVFPGTAGHAGSEWRTRQVLALMDFRTPAAPYHYQKMHLLFPSREVKPAPGGYRFTIARQECSLESLHVNANDNSSLVNRYFERARVTSFLLFGRQELALEHYAYGADASTKFLFNSVSKSIVGLLVGIAVEEGLIDSIDDPITQYLPELQGTGWQGATLRQALQMSTALTYPGVDLDAGGTGRDMAPHVFHGFVEGRGNVLAHLRSATRPPARRHGETWTYLNSNTQVLGMIVARVSGRTLAEYAHDALWSKLGATQSAHWLVDSHSPHDANEQAWVGLIASPRDLARVGLMLINDGAWHGEQIVSRQWIADSLRLGASASKALPGHPGFGYGFQWWVPRDSRGDFLAIGFAGQFLYIDPATDTVIVQSAVNANWNSSSFAEALTVFRASADHCRDTRAHEAGPRRHQPPLDSSQ